MRFALLLLILLVAVGPAAAGRTVLAVNIGWHVGLAFETGDLDRAGFPEIADFPGARWIEVGWGDESFYRDPEAGVAAALRAAFASTGTVLHVVAMPAHPERYLPGAEVVAIRLEDAQFDRLMAYVSGSIDRGGRPRAAALGPGLYPVSGFYPAHGEFSLNRTCNTWVAEALAAAGLAIDPDGVAQAGTLMARLRGALGEEQPPAPEPSELR
ncbi:MAG: DUF2459 domain-containing protein [Thalassobaculum sp.]